MLANNQKIDINTYASVIESSRLKRTFDILFSAGVILFVLPPLFIIIGFLIKLNSPGPIIFRQLRVGKNGRKINFFKFRTMTHPVNNLNRNINSVDLPVITRVGNFLRKSNLDEIPQFINVLIGDLSVVGPRPHAIDFHNEYSLYSAKLDTRSLIKPGITGLSQVVGYRGDVPDKKLNRLMINARIRIDLIYIKNWSFLFDILIVFMTIFPYSSLKWALRFRF